MAILETRGLTFHYEEDGGLALDGVDLSIEEGSFTAILGHNGSGKSTLAKHFNAILLPSGGKVYVGGMDTALEDKLFDIRETAGISPSVPAYILGTAVCKKFGGRVEASELGLTCRSTGLMLPCGHTSRWMGGK